MTVEVAPAPAFTARWKAAISWGAGLLLASLAAAQIPVMTDEFRVNTYTTGRQRDQSIATDAAGNFVIAWTSDGQDGSGSGIFAQRFDATGSPQGAEFQVNTYTSGSQTGPTVGMDSAGDFVVAWISDGQDGDAAGVFAQRYDSGGAPQGGPFQVNTYTTGRQSGPIAGMDGTGNFVIVWESEFQDGDGFGIFGQRYDAAGTPQGGEFQVNQFTTGNQLYPILGMDGTGDFVVTWQSPQDGSGTGIVARRYDSGGTPLGPEFPVNTYTTGAQFTPSVGVGSTGNFVIVWTSALQDGSSYGVFGQRYDAAGVAQGGEFQANTYTTGSQSGANVGVDAAGNYLITWTSIEDGSGLGVFGRRYDPTGAPLAPEFQVNTYTTGVQGYANLAMDPSGNFVVAWSSFGQDGSDYGIYARRGVPDSALQPMKVDADGSGATSNLNGVLESGETVVVEPGWKNTYAAPIAFTGAASGLTGPGGPTYSLPDAAADYGTVAAGAMADCYNATPSHDCYQMTISGARPVPHWDATFTEQRSDGFTKTWTLHVGESFSDVPVSQQFYKFVENIFHNGITGGCGAGLYCPSSSVTRAQMAVFLLKAEHGSGYVPPACTGVFADVTCPSLFADWIEQLYAEGITGGCGGGNYCPGNPVTRAQMSAFLLKASHGPSYVPPTCTGIFPDVACPSQFANWIEELYAEGITGGCGSGNYCPSSPNTRGQMAVFLTKTFGLQLYGP